MDISSEHTRTSWRERTHRILQNSDRNDLHAIDDHSKSNRLDRERTHRILEGSDRDNVRTVDKHHHSRQENQIPVDVERESTHRSLTPVVVIQNPRTKRNENKSFETINPKYQRSNNRRTREAGSTTKSVAPENYTGSVTEIDYQIKQLTAKIDELKKQKKRKLVEMLNIVQILKKGETWKKVIWTKIKKTRNPLRER